MRHMLNFTGVVCALFASVAGAQQLTSALGQNFIVENRGRGEGIELV